MDIVHQFNVNVSPTKVYEAITTPAGIQGWWAKNSEIAGEVGGHHTMNFVKEGMTIIMKFRVDELVKDQTVKWTCVENGNPAWVGTIVQFEIEPSDKGSQVRFSHIGWDKQHSDSPLYISVRPTWEAFMTSLKSYCEHAIGQPW